MQSAATATITRPHVRALPRRRTATRRRSGVGGLRTYTRTLDPGYYNGFGCYPDGLTRNRLLLPMLLAGIFLLAAGALPSPATVVVRLSAEQLVQGAAVVVHGRVARVWSAWDAGRTTIWTHYEVDVADAWKGSPGRTLTISEPGGEVDGVHMTVPGAPRYAVGEEIVVFAQPVPNGYLRTRGWAQGRLLVESAPGSPSGKRVRSDLGGALLADPPEGKGRPSSSAPFNGRDLDELRRRVRALVAAQERSAR